MRARIRKLHRHGGRVVLLTVSVAVAVCVWPPPASLASVQDSPTIEYTLTRVFGAESLSIRGASLSPDGRWIVFAEGDETTRSNLWLISTEGGEPIPLTKGPFIDRGPIWFPSSDRIAFVSTRAPIWAIMTLPLDTLSGRPTGFARQVTLDSIEPYFDISPDGKWIAYVTRGDRGFAIKVIPATGGTARTIADPAGLEHMWSPDSRSIYYMMRRWPSQESAFMRVFVNGGRPETAFTWPEWILLPLGGPNRHFVLRRPLDAPGREIATLEGHSLGRLNLPRGMQLWGISSEGDQILAIRPRSVASLTILPVDGGPGRQLTEAHAYNDPLGWSEDGRVLFETELSGEAVMLYAPVAGGPMPQVKLPEPRAFGPVLSGDGKHLFYAVREGESELPTLKVYSIEEDWSWELSRNFFPDPGGRLSGTGGTRDRDGDDFLYFEKREGHYALFASPPQGPARLMRTFAGKLPGSVGVHGNRIAYVENSGEEATLFLATAGKAAARRLLNLHGILDMVVWSPDGRRMAAHHYPLTRSIRNRWDPVGLDLIVFEVRLSGEIVGEPVRYSVPASHWWSPRWLPDGQAVLVNGVDANVWLIPLDPNARPVAITQDDPNGAWYYELSPDGRHIAYSSGRRLGSSIWLLKLEEPL